MAWLLDEIAIILTFAQNHHLCNVFFYLFFYFVPNCGTLMFQADNADGSGEEDDDDNDDGMDEIEEEAMARIQSEKDE